MVTCNYEYKGYKCKREPLKDSPKGLCILHEEWEHKDPKKTKEALYKEIDDGKTDFTGCILPEIELSSRTIEGRAVFTGATIKGGVNFRGVKIKRNVYFEDAIIEGDVLFDEKCEMKNSAIFTGAKIKGNAFFEGVEIKEEAYFGGATIEGDALFEKATIGTAMFKKATIKRAAYFRGATINGDALFDGAEIGGALFQEETIEEDARFKGLTEAVAIEFDGSKIRGNVSFFKVTIKGFVSFQKAIIEENAIFDGVKIEGAVSFNGATIEEFASFKKAWIKGDVLFDGAAISGATLFDEAKIKGTASFDNATIGGSTSFPLSEIFSVTFRDTKFGMMSAQEAACRTARISQEARGRRFEADNYFYREMEAKRKQYVESKKVARKLRGFLELPLQYVFGYGVKPFLVIGWWLATVFILAMVYAIWNAVVPAYSPLEYMYFSLLTSATPGYQGYIFAFANWIRSLFGWTVNEIEKTFNLFDYLGKCMYFSITSAATPGYGGYTPRPGFEILATLEAIFGTFMWAAFIATVARKYMRS